MLYGYDPDKPNWSKRLITDFSKHPNVRFPIEEWHCARNWSTAAGAYQINYRLWYELEQTIGLQDFTPNSQDRAAIHLIPMVDVMGGHLVLAIGKCSKVWPALPGSLNPKVSKPLAFARRAYLDAGGIECD